MLRKIIFVIVFICLCVVYSSQPAAAYEYENSYNLYVQLGQEALQNKKYREAKSYFKTAIAINPDQPQAKEYLKLIRGLENKSIRHKPKKTLLKRQSAPLYKKPTIQKAKSKESLAQQDEVNVERKKIGITAKAGDLKQMSDTADYPIIESVKLDDDLWQYQPDMPVEIEARHSIVFRTEYFQKFLLLSDDSFSAQKISRDEIKVLAKKRGSTFLLIWDQTRRWTFHLTTVFPQPTNLPEDGGGVAFRQSNNKPFQFLYSNNWTAYYRGDSVKGLKRNSYSYRQWAGMSAPTPYGLLDASVEFYEFDSEMKVVGQAVGLSDGRLGPFRDFTIRGFDTQASFSPLSLPGKYFRGILIDDYAFDKNFKYTWLKGQDRSTFLFLSPGVFNTRQSFIEAFQLRIFPDSDHQYELNWGTGSGAERETYLKDHVFSFQTQHKFLPFFFEGEVAYDKDEFASTLMTTFDYENHLVKFAFRDINRNFSTITERPLGRGEIGGRLMWDWNNKQNQNFSTSLDVYRDREQKNAISPDKVNLNFDMSYAYAFTPTLHWTNSMYYAHLPQLTSPRKSFRVNNSLLSYFPLWGKKKGSVSLGNFYQFNRYSQNPTSEYDRYGVNANLRIPLFKNLSYFIRYEYSIVDEKSNDNYSYPSSMDTGLSQNFYFTDKLSANVFFSYRNEENTEDDFSFLAGEDNITGSIGLTYRPFSNTEIFVDGRMRNVWAENKQRDNYNDADVRFGMRSTWDSPFYWNPVGEIVGIVYRDYNNNSVREEDEPGIPNAVVQVGKQTVFTDEAGIYQAKIRAKKVRVSLDVDKLPPGYVFSSLLAKDIEIENLESYVVDFGVTTQSGIYGIVYFDINKNQKFDSDDILVPRVTLTLDNQFVQTSGPDGTYYFNNISPARHILVIDVNSIPLEYLPTISIRNSIEVEEGSTAVFHVPLKENPQKMEE